jgi:hypothetical protein
MLWACLIVLTAVFAVTQCNSELCSTLFNKNSQPVGEYVNGILNPRSGPLRETHTILKVKLPMTSEAINISEVRTGVQKQTFQCVFGFGKSSDLFEGKIRVEASARIMKETGTEQEVLSVECSPPSSFPLAGKCNAVACAYLVDIVVGGGRTRIANDSFVQYNLCPHLPSTCDSLAVEAVYATHWRYASHKRIVRVLGRNLGYLPDIICQFRFADGSVKVSRPENRHVPPGLKWEAVGEAKPLTGIEISNKKKLAEVLAGKKEFTNDELEAFNVSAPSHSSYIKVSDIYFKPSHFDFVAEDPPIDVSCSSNGNKYDMFPLPNDKYMPHDNSLFIQLGSLFSWDELRPPSHAAIWPSIVAFLTIIWWLAVCRLLSPEDRLFWECSGILILCQQAVWFYLWSEQQASKPSIYGPLMGLALIAVCLAVVRCSYKDSHNSEIQQNVRATCCVRAVYA